MYKQKLDLATATALESQGLITIVDCSSESLQPLEQHGQTWKDNFKTLQTKHRHISPDKLMSFLDAQYTIEVSQQVGTAANQFIWRYLHGIKNSSIQAKNADDVEYVYILVNAGYPNMVKIGMTTNSVEGRVTELNASSTVNEWVAKFAIPVSKGSARKVEQSVHKFFASFRVSSDMGGSREFFTIDCLTAFDKVREVGAMFMVGNPIVY